MGVILSAASALEWWSGICSVDPATLIGELGEDLRAPGPVTFLPYLSGERTPHNDPHLRAGFSGLSHATTRTDLTRAVLEGVAFALRENREALTGTGTQINRLIATGGGSRSIYWLKLLASVLGIPVELPARGDFAAALGAARLGMIASGDVSIPAACYSPNIDQVFEPEPRFLDSLSSKYERFVDDRTARKGR